MGGGCDMDILNPYTDKERREFARRNIEFLGRELKPQARNLIDDYASVLGAMPWWMQIIIIESRKKCILGTHEEVNKQWASLRKPHQSESVNGFYSGRDDRNYTSMAARGGNFWLTHRHEIGHQLSRFLVQTGLTTQARFWFSETPQWQGAFQKTKDRIDRIANGGFLKRFIMRCMERDSMDPRTLYDGARDLFKDHLVSYEEEDEHAEEALAEMTNHYLSLHAKYENDPARTQKVYMGLESTYPDLWQEYQRGVIRAGKKLAEGLWLEKMSLRALEIEDYTMALYDMDVALGCADAQGAITTQEIHKYAEEAEAAYRHYGCFEFRNAMHRMQNWAGQAESFVQKYHWVGRQLREIGLDVGPDDLVDMQNLYAELIPQNEEDGDLFMRRALTNLRGQTMAPQIKRYAEAIMTAELGYSFRMQGGFDSVSGHKMMRTAKLARANIMKIAGRYATQNIEAVFYDETKKLSWRGLDPVRYPDPPLSYQLPTPYMV